MVCKDRLSINRCLCSNETMLLKHDEALYQAKEGARNRVCIALTGA